MSKVMGIYVKFTKTTHQIWSYHVTPASNSENFYFLPNSILNFKEINQIWGKLTHKQKRLQAKNKLGGGKDPPPSAYRVKRIVFNLFKTDNLIAFQCSSVIYPYLMLSP